MPDDDKTTAPPQPSPSRVLVEIDDLIRIELTSGRVPVRYRHVVKLCKIAEILSNIYARRADDFRVGGDIEDGLEGWGLEDRDPNALMDMPGGGMNLMAAGGAVQPDAADLVRQATSVIQDQTEEKKSSLAQLERLTDVRERLVDAGHDTTVIDARIRDELGKEARRLPPASTNGTIPIEQLLATSNAGPYADEIAERQQQATTEDGRLQQGFWCPVHGTGCACEQLVMPPIDRNA